MTTRTSPLWLPRIPYGRVIGVLPTCNGAFSSSMIASRVPALRVPPRRPDTRVAAADQTTADMEGRRDPSAATPADNPAAADHPAKADLDRLGSVRRAAHAHPALTPRLAAPVHHPRHYPALSPRHHPPPLGRKIQTEQARTTTGPPPHRPPGTAHGHRQRALGVPADHRRAGRARHRRRTFDSLGNPQEARHRPRAPACRPGLGAVPALPGRSDPGPGPVHRRLLDETKACVLAAIEHATRRIRILGAFRCQDT